MLLICSMYTQEHSIISAVSALRQSNQCVSINMSIRFSTFISKVSLSLCCLESAFIPVFIHVHSSYLHYCIPFSRFIVQVCTRLCHWWLPGGVLLEIVQPHSSQTALHMLTLWPVRLHGAHTIRILTTIPWDRFQHRFDGLYGLQILCEHNRKWCSERCRAADICRSPRARLAVWYVIYALSICLQYLCNLSAICMVRVLCVSNL